MDIKKDTIQQNIVKQIIMRFIRKEHIVTTIFNKDLTEEDEIKTVFVNLEKYSVEFSIIIKKFMPLQNDYFNMTFEKVRIKKVYDDNTLDILAFKSGIKTTMKKLAFSDIVQVSAITIKHKILDIDSDINRFELLDL